MKSNYQRDAITHRSIFDDNNHLLTGPVMIKRILGTYSKVLSR